MIKCSKCQRILGLWKEIIWVQILPLPPPSWETWITFFNLSEPVFSSDKWGKTTSLYHRFVKITCEHMLRSSTFKTNSGSHTFQHPSFHFSASCHCQISWVLSLYMLFPHPLSFSIHLIATGFWLHHLRKKLHHKDYLIRSSELHSHSASWIMWNFLCTWPFWHSNFVVSVTLHILSFLTVLCYFFISN